jgi:hypothetical protein
MAITPSPTVTEADLFTALRAAILPITGTPVYKGLSNDVPQPNVDYVVLNPVLIRREATNHTEYMPNSLEIDRVESALFTYTVQIDAYGLQSGNIINVLAILFRSDYFNSSGITPLYPSEPRMIMFESSESNMIERWSMDVHLSFEPKLVMAQQSATEIHIASIVDAG